MTITTIPQADPTGAKTNVWREILDATGCAFDLATSSLAKTSVSIAAQESQGRDLFIDPTGTHVFVVGITNSLVQQYILNTPWDADTLAHVSNFNPSTEGFNPKAVFLNPEGTKMYLSLFDLSSFKDELYEYDLDAWDVTSAVFSGDQYRDATAGDVDAFTISEDGTKLYSVSSGTNTIHQHTFGTPYAVASLSYDGVSFNSSPATATPYSPVLNKLGTKMYTSSTISTGDETGDAAIFEIDLDAFDLSTAAYNGVYLNIESEDGTPTGLALSRDSVSICSIFVLGQANDNIFQFST